MINKNYKIKKSTFTDNSLRPFQLLFISLQKKRSQEFVQVMNVCEYAVILDSGDDSILSLYFVVSGHKSLSVTDIETFMEDVEQSNGIKSDCYEGKIHSDVTPDSVYQALLNR